MSAAEIADRTRQELQKRIDVLQYRLRAMATRRTAAATGPQGTFFFAASEVPAILSAMRAHLPQQADAILAQAEEICSHRFRLLGYENVQYGQSIDWHLDAVHQKSSPPKPWFKIDYFDRNEVGDPKITWELNRHQHLVLLAKAFRLTGNRRFADELFAQWHSWQEQNPYPIGINWASSLEVAFRSLSWLWVWFLLQGTDAVPAGFSPELLSALSLAGRHIERYLSTYTSPNTHLLGEAVGLFFIGTLCPRIPNASSWQRKSWQIVLDETQNQVRPDGFHFEQSTYYHVYALDLFLHAGMLASRNGIEIPAGLDETLERMLDALTLLAQSGAPPSFGDDDGGRVFDSSRNRRKHLIDPLAVGAVLFDRGDCKQVAQAMTEEGLWLLGAGAFDNFDRIPDPCVAMRSAALVNSGSYVMVNSRGEQLVIDAGPQGTHTAGHGHADALSIHLSADGRELLTDPGTCHYNGEERRWFRSTAAHNTLQVDGCDQADPKTPFSWAALPTTTVERWITGNEFDVFCGNHDGYQRLEQPVTHQRWVINFKRGCWLVRDVVSGSADHDLDIAWHFPPDASSDNEAICHDPASGLTIVFAHDLPWTASVREEPWSPAYGRNIPGRTLHHRLSTTLPAEFSAVLVCASADREIGDVRLIPSGYAYSTSSAEYRVIFGDGARPWSSIGLTSDADLLCCIIRNRQIEALLICNGTYVDWQGQRLVSASLPARWCELVRRGSTFHVSSPDQEILTAPGRPEVAEPASAGQGTSERMGS